MHGMSETLPSLLQPVVLIISLMFRLVDHPVLLAGEWVERTGIKAFLCIYYSQRVWRVLKDCPSVWYRVLDLLFYLSKYLVLETMLTD